MKSNKIEVKISQRIIYKFVMILFLYIVFIPQTFANAATGYHTEYHKDHEWDNLGIVTGDMDWCNVCGNYTMEATRQKYVYKCNETVYKTCFWSVYNCTSCGGTLYESTLFSGHCPGDGTPHGDDVSLDKIAAEPDYNNFLNTFLPGAIECPGYEAANTYEVAYNPNGGTGNTMKNSSHTYNKSKKLTENTYTKKGYSFHEWNTKKDGSGDCYSNKVSVKNLTSKNNGKVTLYAQWKANKYTLNVNPNGGNYKNSTDVYSFQDGLKYDSDWKDSLGTSGTKKGYTLKGYYTKTSGGTLIYDSNGIIVNDGTYWKDGKYIYADNLTVYAQWIANKYTVTYHPNGGITSATNTIYNYNDAVSLIPTASKGGYRFVGWATSPDADKPLTSFVMPDLATSSNTDYSSDWELTLYALYSIDVSDVSNHNYPSYQKVNANEVELLVWKTSAPAAYKIYPLAYTEDAGIMYYSYQLGNTDISSFVGNNTYGYSLVAYDNAGNYSVLDGTNPPIPKFYWQTVNHWKLDAASNNPEYFDTTSSYVQEGTTFTPTYITPPTGYEVSHMDNSAYTVAGIQTTNAYYKPKTFTLFFHPNGGNSVSPATKYITYNDYYGEMPTPTRKGYGFTGWYTTASGGNLVKDSDIYAINGNSTLYAHWNVNSYKVEYDYRTNGGTSVNKESDIVAYNSNIDLSPKAAKDGWSFIGWNTNPNATTGLTTLTMSDKDVVLYAIYKKDITATFIDNHNKSTRKITTTIYNRDTSCKITTPSITTINGWNSLGWSFDTQANADVHISSNVSYELCTDQILYACYVQNITISYDTNGSAEEIPSQTKERFFNAFGNFDNPVFIAADAPKLEKHSFVQWEELQADGTVKNSYPEKMNIVANSSLQLTAKWDRYPEIEAYDRYFTLEEALNGEITTQRLLEKVTATDREDGTLVNGKNVTIVDLNQYDFIHHPEVSITYQAGDSLGNIIKKSITVYVVDTAVTLSPTRFFARFINSTFYTNEGIPITEENGSLESSSIWKMNKSYQQLLEYTLESKAPIHSFFFSKDKLSNKN